MPPDVRRLRCTHNILYGNMLRHLGMLAHAVLPASAIDLLPFWHTGRGFTNIPFVALPRRWVDASMLLGYKMMLHR